MLSPRLLLLLLCAAGCGIGQPTSADVEGLAHVDQTSAHADVRIYHTPDIEAGEARALLPKVGAVCAAVFKRLGYRPPRTELVIYEPAGPMGASGHRVHETRGDLAQEDAGWRIRFLYPWRDDRRSLGRLLGTTAHEVAEATVLLRVTVLDPYLRWIHDGIAELVEHQVLLELDPEAARSGLDRIARFVADRRHDGITHVDLTRWRQLAPYLVRSHRFFGPQEQNLSLTRLPQSLRRVRNAMLHLEDPVFSAGLRELEEILRAAQRTAAKPLQAGEARPDDPLVQDFLFYNAAFIVWLELERSSPGTVRRVIEALAARREDDDHVLTAQEASRVVAAAAGRELPPLERFPLERIQAALEAERDRLAQ